METVIKKINKKEEKKEESYGMNLDFFMDSNNKSLQISDYDPKPATKKRKKKIKKVGDKEYLGSDEKSKDLQMWQSNVPYEKTYDETTNILKGTISEIDHFSVDLKNDIDSIRKSKTIRKKYDYLTNMLDTQGSLISTKINAVKEINKTITDSNNLDLKRMSGIASAGLNKDDTRAITDMYNAFVQTPVGNNGSNPFGFPSQAEMSTVEPGIVRQGFKNSGDMGYTEFMNNPTEEQATVLASNNKNLETVVLYDENAPIGQQIMFDVVDKNTNQSVPGVDRPDPMFLENLRIEPELGIASDNNLAKTYRLINKSNPNITLSQY